MAPHFPEAQASCHANDNVTSKSPNDCCMSLHFIPHLLFASNDQPGTIISESETILSLPLEELLRLPEHPITWP